MSATCYVNLSWAIGGAVGSSPFLGMNINYVLVDDTSGLSLPTANYGSCWVTDTTAGSLDDMRAQGEAAVQAQETDTPDLTFVWLF